MTYQQYVNKQKEKLTRYATAVKAADTVLGNVLGIRILKDAIDLKGKSVLCLGARLGAEVRVFRGLGAFAVGVDLNPGQENRYVLTGDFQSLQFPPACADVVFSNSLDHALEIGLMLREAYRVLKPQGQLITEVQHGSEEGYHFDSYDVYHWKTTDEIVAKVAAGGFAELNRQRFTRPWHGTHLLWKKDPKQRL